MSYYAKVIADSIAQQTRLTTLEVCFPRFILAEFNTHRLMSRNSASSRAIPVKRRIEQVSMNPFVPEAFGKNRSGMQSLDSLSKEDSKRAREIWIRASQRAVQCASELAEIGVHKQHANRLIETFAWHTVVFTATELDNFLALRDSKNAQPEIQIVARLMKTALADSKPKELLPGEWHLPYLLSEDSEHETDVQLKLSVARCAAVSYERQTADRPLDVLIKRHDMLHSEGHMSPFEHQAQVKTITESENKPFHPLWEKNWTDYQFVDYFCGNFRAPFLQYRKTLTGERVYKGDLCG